MVAATTSETWDAAWTLTMRAHRKRLTDNISDSYPTLGRFRKAGVMEVETGGKEIQEDLMYGLGSSEWFDGFDVLSTNAVDGITAAFYQFRYNATSVVISDTEDAESRKAGSTKLITAKSKQAMTKSFDTVNSAIFGSQSGKSMLGLQDICAESTGTTLGGISQSTNTWWDNKREDFNASYTSFLTKSGDQYEGTLRMGAMWNECSEGNDKPDLILASFTHYGNYEAIFEGTGMTRFVESGKRAGPNFGLGAEGDVTFRGAPVIADRDCTTDNMYFLNTKYLKLKVQGGKNFAKTPFREPSNQLARVAFVVFGAQLVTNNRRRQGVLYDLA
ncbi:hypothetical protein CMI37_17625 [Candidatus Pacearchaeota archaeon]|nr:hypothetical protein [Candidatus Pacearchaeota archaeon]|tara:strand:+ start:2554 stop:3546 length:993 start_codon:yes stop_codon:yes gene_type:complete